MKSLDKVLTASSKSRRHRRNLVNIHITFIGWLVECLYNNIILLGTGVLGNSSPFITLLLQTLTITIQCNIVPLVYLINDPKRKANIVDSRYYFMFLNFLNLQNYSQNEVPDNEENNQVQVE